ncbi:MAG: hypothetical protein UZ18_ATM001002038 [Armatimonadetes bacterium OLB18]|nr:MAG: hypothetical protein UZ18_ATM001002038 [Armatimonadetes bacterium OLB18]
MRGLGIARWAQSAGTTCRVGCNDWPLSQCENYYVPAKPPYPPTFLYSKRTTRYPHLECGWAWGQDTCVPLPDDACILVEWFMDPNCSGPRWGNDLTTTSTCELPGSGG